VQAIAEELGASQQRREMIAPAMLPVISRDADHYDSQIYAVCGGGALLPSGGFDCCERHSGGQGVVGIINPPDDRDAGVRE
jgi:hypothetical protein